MSVLGVVTAALSIPRPSAGIDVHGICQQIESWSESCTDIGEMHEVKAKLSAIDQYIAQTSTEGRAAVSATVRRLEVRIGVVLGEAKPGNPTGANQHGGTSAAPDVPLTKHERSEFRKMADAADVVEEVIAASTDDKPASRAKVLGEIARRGKGAPVPPLYPPKVETLAERDERERLEGVERSARRIQRFLDGVAQFRHLATHPERDEILALLTDRDRADLAEWEGRIQWLDDAR